jgi:hypothetical protein
MAAVIAWSSFTFGGMEGFVRTSGSFRNLNEKAVNLFERCQDRNLKCWVLRKINL